MFGTEDPSNNKRALFAFKIFAIGLVVHTVVMVASLSNWAFYIAFLLYLIGSIIGIITWINHFRGKRLSYFSMIISGLVCMPMIITIILLIKIYFSL